MIDFLKLSERCEAERRVGCEGIMKTLIDLSDIKKLPAVFSKDECLNDKLFLAAANLQYHGYVTEGSREAKTIDFMSKLFNCSILYTKTVTIEDHLKCYSLDDAEVVFTAVRATYNTLVMIYNALMQDAGYSYNEEGL